jgi:hypothetical protein
MNGQQGGDPAKLADALVHLAGLEEPSLRFAAGADAVAAFERRANNLLAQCPAAWPSIRTKSRPTQHHFAYGIKPPTKV